MKRDVFERLHTRLGDLDSKRQCVRCSKRCADRGEPGPVLVKSLCPSCYKRSRMASHVVSGRNYACGHHDRWHEAKGMCHKCYVSAWGKQRRKEVALLTG